MAVRVVTDSACDLTDELVAELGIEVVPLTVRFGDEELADRRDLSPSQFYAKMATTTALPETAAPSPGDFEAAFRKMALEGADAVVCVNLSSGLSASIESARNAARALEGTIDVRVVDSRSVTWGLGSQVVAAARAGAEGASADEVVAVVEDMVPRTRVLAALDTLENLRKGGRIGAAQALLGTMLAVKPLIQVRDGVVAPAGKTRTRAKALRHLADHVAAQTGVENLGVMHAGAPDAQQLVDLLAAGRPREEVHVGEIGATIGSHTGPRVIGVAFQIRT